MTFLVERPAGIPGFALWLLSTGNRRSVRAFCVEIFVHTTGEPAL
jgi:hypothetical protein